MSLYSETPSGEDDAHVSGTQVIVPLTYFYINRESYNFNRQRRQR